MADQMPKVNAEFGTTPVIEFPAPEAPKVSRPLSWLRATARWFVAATP